jgi:hypothetical protein
MESSSTAYHVTLTRNVARIMREGLHPRRGPRSRRLGESHRAVYLFKGREDAADGLVNWLGDELPEDEPVALIMVSLPTGACILATTADYELVVADHIPPENLTVIELDWGSF